MSRKALNDAHLSLERLRSFLSIANAGGISLASRENPTRQSQLSRQLKDLETYFGELMERQGGRRVLNERGKLLAEHIRWTLRGLEALKGGGVEEPPPTFVLAAGDSVLHWRILPRIARVGARFEIVALPAQDVIARLLDGSAHLGVVRKEDVPATLERRAIGSVEHALCVPRALARGIADEDLLFALPLAVQIADTDFLASLTAHAAKRARTLDVALRCESFPQVLRAVQSGRYAGLLPTWAEDDLRASQFRFVTVAGRHSSPLHLAWTPRLVQVQRDAKQVIDRLVAVLRDDA